MNQLSPAQCFEQLSTLLRRQTADIDDIHAYLGDIKAAIAKGDTVQLNQLVVRQRLPIPELDELEVQRHQLLKLYGYQTDREAMKTCIAWCDQNAVLTELYDTFEKALLRLRDSIQLNSLLISKGQKRIRQSLHLLTGQGQSDQAQLYSSNGQTEDLQSGRSIAQA